MLQILSYILRLMGWTIYSILLQWPWPTITNLSKSVLNNSKFRSDKYVIIYKNPGIGWRPGYFIAFSSFHRYNDSHAHFRLHQFSFIVLSFPREDLCRNGVSGSFCIMESATNTDSKQIISPTAGEGSTGSDVKKVQGFSYQSSKFFLHLLLRWK